MLLFDCTVNATSSQATSDGVFEVVDCKVHVGVDAINYWLGLCTYLSLKYG